MNFFNHFLSSKKKYFFLFTIAFTIKFLSCYYLVSIEKECGNSKSVVAYLAIRGGDSRGYLTPIDNFIEKGEYYIQRGDKKVYMGRAPYYGIPYFIFRVFFSKEISYDLVVIFQILLEAIAIIYLSVFAKELLKSKVAFWSTYILMLISLNMTYWANYLQTESFSISILVIFCYYFYQYLTYIKKSDLFISAILLSLLVVLKPYFGLFYIFCGIGFLIRGRNNIPSVFKNTILFSLPLILIVSPYTIRNYIRFNCFQPLSELDGGCGHTSATYAYHDFLRAWGGSFQWWDTRSAGCYFELHSELQCKFILPEYALCEAYTRQDIEQVRTLFINYQKVPSKLLEDSVTKEFNKLTTQYKQYRPFRYYVMSPLLLVKDFLFHNGSYYLIINNYSKCDNLYHWVIKIYQSLLYYFSLLIGFFGLTYIYIKQPFSYTILIIPVYLIIVFPILLGASEFRYFAPSYPFLILGTSVLFYQVINRYFADKRKINH